MIRARITAITATACLALTLACAGGKPALQVGAPIEIKKAVSIAQVSAHPENFVGQKVRLEGTVSQVCKGMGCWVEVQAADGSVMMAKSLDHSILLPTDCEGRKIVLQGVVTEMPPAEQTEEKPEGDHECPRPTYLVATMGIELR